MKIENINSNLFSVDGDLFQKGLFTIDYKDKGIKIIQRETGLLIGGGVAYRDWKTFRNSNGDSFADYATFVTALSEAVFVEESTQTPVEDLPYKVYTALLSHDAGNASPTALVLQNTIGEIIWSYEEPVAEPMSYTGLTSGLLTLNKTVIFVSSPHSPFMQVGANTFNENAIALKTDADQFSRLNIEIRVYN